MSAADDVITRLASLASENYCYLTTRGRVTGKPHEIEIWFGAQNRSIYLLSGGGHDSDWVKNMRKDPNVQVRIARKYFEGAARLVQDEAEELTARNMLADKYNERESDGSLSEWARTALVVAIDLREMSS